MKAWPTLRPQDVVLDLIEARAGTSDAMRVGICARATPSPSAATITPANSGRDTRPVLQHAPSHGDRGIPAKTLIAGSVDKVAEQFRAFEELGYTDILVRHLSNDQPKVLGSLERLAAVHAVLA